MADYFNFRQVAQKCGIAEGTIAQLERNGLLEPTIKKGMAFLSSQQVYRLRIAVQRAKKERIDLQEALAKVEKHWLAQVTALRN